MGRVDSGMELPRSDQLRTRFSQMMSDMYKNEVPLYGQLLSIVSDADDKMSTEHLSPRHRIERHGAVRLGTADELRTIKRLFALFNMHPVGYYDLSVVGFPMHSTAFRPLTSAALANNPFRVFTTLLRPDLIDPSVRSLAEQALSKRCLFSERLLRLIQHAETSAGLSAADEDDLLSEALDIFRWHQTATVSIEDYKKLSAGHPMIADIASFPSAHINHLTPRTLDIDLVQQTMKDQGIPAKERIEGPPRRVCDILLRQTSFKALEERVRFVSSNGEFVDGHHTARFGEVEQRGAAVTRKGRALYDKLLAQTRAVAAAQGATDEEYELILHGAFRVFPDEWSVLRAQGLAFFRYTVTAAGLREARHGGEQQTLSRLVAYGHVEFEPIVYEDFLPISAAGIFTSNLSSSSQATTHEAKGDLALMEASLGCSLEDPTTLYEQMQAESVEECRRVLGLAMIVV
ncbi:hypothetical protein LTR08_003624 [Meristemomyces frigidus]|nr:hypothetical protein LTR08_003624 [Meristemomyces frigidus]